MKQIMTRELAKELGYEIIEGQNAENILEDLYNTNGYCPCVPKRLYNENTYCPCAAFRNKGNCHCELFKKREV